MTSKLMLDAAEENYTATPGMETLASKLDGGKSRFRRIQLGAAAVIAVTWFLTAAQYSYLMAFYRLRTAHGSLPFTFDVVLDSGALVTYTGTFVPGSLVLNEVQGATFITQAQVEVIPVAEDSVADLATITAYEASL